MKGYTLWQPWASLVAIGEKRIETRSRRMHFRGPLAIHAAQQYRLECRAFANASPACDVLRAAGMSPEHLPLGAIVAMATVTACVPVEEVLAAANAGIAMLPYELAFGNYEAGRFGIMLADVRRLPEPIAFKAKQGLWNVPAEIVDEIHRQVRKAS